MLHDSSALDAVEDHQPGGDLTPRCGDIRERSPLDATDEVIGFLSRKFEQEIPAPRPDTTQRLQ